jgi:hypothetical protein
MTRLQPSIHLSLGLPVLRVSSGFQSRVLHCSQFPGIPFMFPKIVTVFLQLLPILYILPYIRVCLMMSFRKFSLLGSLSDILQISTPFSGGVLT